MESISANQTNPTSYLKALRVDYLIAVDRYCESEGISDLALPELRQLVVLETQDQIMGNWAYFVSIVEIEDRINRICGEIDRWLDYSATNLNEDEYDAIRNPWFDNFE